MSKNSKLNLKRAISIGALLWLIIFIEWSIIVMTPVLKDLKFWQYVIHFFILIPIVCFGASYYYKNKNNTNGFLLGLVMMLTAAILDAVITVPLLVIPQGGSYIDFFFSVHGVFFSLEFIAISGIFWCKKIK